MSTAAQRSQSLAHVAVTAALGLLLIVHAFLSVRLLRPHAGFAAILPLCIVTVSLPALDRLEREREVEASKLDEEAGAAGANEQPMPSTLSVFMYDHLTDVRRRIAARAGVVVALGSITAGWYAVWLKDAVYAIVAMGCGLAAAIELYYVETGVVPKLSLDVPRWSSMSTARQTTLAAAGLTLVCSGSAIRHCVLGHMRLPLPPWAVLGAVTSAGVAAYFDYRERQRVVNETPRQCTCQAEKQPCRCHQPELESEGAEMAESGRETRQTRGTGGTRGTSIAVQYAFMVGTSGAQCLMAICLEHRLANAAGGM